jgi:hypothetical protein
LSGTNVFRSDGEKSWFLELLEMRKKWSHRHISFGWMCPAVLNKYARRIGVEFERKVKRAAGRRVLPCFKCGEGVMMFQWAGRNLTLADLADAGIPILRREVGRVNWHG